MCVEVTDILDSVCLLIWIFSIAFNGGAYWAPHSESSGWEEGHILATSTFLPLLKDLLVQWHLGSHFDGHITSLPLILGGMPPALTLTSKFYLVYNLIPHPPGDQNPALKLHLTGGGPSGLLWSYQDIVLSAQVRLPRFKPGPTLWIVDQLHYLPAPQIPYQQKGKVLSASQGFHEG